MELGKIKRVVREVMKRNDMISVVANNSKDDKTYKKVGPCFKEMNVREEILKVARDLNYSMLWSAISRTIIIIQQKTMFREGRDMYMPVNMIEMRNGVFFTDTLEYVPEPAQRVISLYKSPTIYNPDAKCPKFDKFLEEVLPNINDRILVLEMIGYCLNTTDNRLRKAFFLLGVGANGKSTLVKIITDLLGKDNVSSIVYSKFTDSFHIQYLKRKMANIHPAVKFRGQADISILRDIIEGKKIFADRKHKSAIEFQSRVKLILAQNQLPRMDATCVDFLDAWIVIKFMQDFREAGLPMREWDIINDPDEMSGIFNKAVQALTRIREWGFSVRANNLMRRNGNDSEAQAY